MIDFEKIKVVKSGFGHQMIRRESLPIFQNYGWSLELEPPETPKEVAAGTPVRVLEAAGSIVGKFAAEPQTSIKRTRKSKQK